MTRFLNPYNFVRPLPGPTEVPGDEPELHLLWRCPPPPHDRYTGLSGRITCNMTAVTPVFVSDSENVYPPGRDVHQTYRFFQVDGKEVIPASGLRGAIRSIFEAVTNSTWSIFSDQTLSYRTAAHDARGLIPGCIDYDADRNKWHVVLMTGTSQIGQNGIPEGLSYAAWVAQYYTGAQAGRNLSLLGFEHGQVCFAAMKRENNYWDVRTLVGTQDKARLRDLQKTAQNNNWKFARGVLCITGKNIPNKHNERFFFTESNKVLAVPDREIERYNVSIKLMRQYHHDRGTDPSELSRYHTQPIECELLSPDNPLIVSPEHAFPVYVKLNDAGQVDYLVPVSVPRVLERRSFFEIMREEGFAHLLPADHFELLSPADRVFGWVHQDADRSDVTQRVAFRGRVRFSHADIVDWTTVRNGQPEILSTPAGRINGALSILSSPKPTTTRFYADLPGKIKPDAQLSDEQLRYGKKGVRLRGRKVYRHHGRAFRWDGEAKQTPGAPNTEQNRTIEGAHPAGTTYRFTVDFDNLQPVELGALLWTLELRANGFQGYHRIGYGKPLGLGSVTIEVDDLEFIDLHNRYLEFGTLDNLERDGLVSKKDLIEPLKTRFMSALFQLYSQTQPEARDFWQLVNVADLCALLQEPESAELPIHYPRPRIRRAIDGKNYEWFVNNKRAPSTGAPQLVLPYAVDDTTGLPYLYWDGPNRRVRTDE